MFMKLKKNVFGLIAVSLFLSGCAASVLDRPSVVADVKVEAASEPQKLALEGIKRLEEKRFDEASVFFNKALKLDISNSYLQFLNALAYHLRALQGDSTLFNLAEEGYKLAIKFDRTNWMALYHRGLLYLDRREFAAAQRFIAEAAFYKSDSPELFYNLAVASYYAEDPVTAAGALEKLRAIKPEGAKELRASSLVLAALGEKDKADLYFSRYEKAANDPRAAQLVRMRLENWRRFHSRNGGVVKAQFSPNPAFAVESGPLSSPETLQGAEQAQDEPNPEEEETEEGQEEPIPDDYKMVIVDVVIIRTEEDLTTSKGVNLLNGLTLQFGKTDASNSGFSYDHTFSKVTGSLTSAITTAINIKSINYSMNIANSNTTRNEILARPTLVALAGEQSQFFSGVEVDAAAVGGSSSDGATLSVQKEIGVKLLITPEFLEDGRIKLNVEAERTFLTTPNTTSVTFTLRIDTSKTNVNANVAMNFGETLILSGLSEKETERTRDGVPFLQDIPVVQYLFSKRTTRDFQKSVLILLTPRLPLYTFQNKKSKKKAQRRMSRDEKVLSELQARYSDWFKPYPNWASIFHHMQQNTLYREFRTGDVTLEKWQSQATLRERLRQAMEFLYF